MSWRMGSKMIGKRRMTTGRVMQQQQITIGSENKMTGGGNYLNKMYWH
jgi:hypothetical protein